ncbi:MAG: hypothetical protein L3K19_01285 [Thermoplasmata archaeon]|nr:hypothetical protein [Thermoplasmata archaeon]
MSANYHFALAHLPSEDVPLLDADLISDGPGGHSKVSLGDFGLAENGELQEANNES